MDDDFDYTYDRLVSGEVQIAEQAGFGATKKGQALARRYQAELEADIAQDRKHPEDRDVWRALKGLDDKTIAVRLLVLGISLADSEGLGVDRDTGEKDFRECAVWLGRSFHCHGVEALLVGNWATNRLLSLDAFTRDDDDILRLTDKADDFMHEVLAHHVRKFPWLSPLATPPEDWTGFRKGGLPDGHWAQVPLIQNANKVTESAVRGAISTGQMQPVLDAINSLQRVPFTINEPVLDFIKKHAEPKPVPEKPPIWQKKKFREWQQARTRAWSYETDLAIADAMLVARRFWVPLRIDFRGRIYGIPHFNFQRDDRTRALFLFANGEPIGHDGLKWLKSHVAKTANGIAWGPTERPGDLGFEERIAWVDDDYNSTVIRRVGEAVIDRKDPATIAWALSKDPYQFVAACAELVQALDKGPTFETRLPVTFDGTCSGLQHMCAMMRAEEGEFVNLTDKDEGDDFYQRVTFNVWRLLRRCMPDVQCNKVIRRLVYKQISKRKWDWVPEFEAPLIALDYDIVNGDDSWVRKRGLRVRTDCKRDEAPLVDLDYDIICGDDDWVDFDSLRPGKKSKKHRPPQRYWFQWLMESPFSRVLGKPTGMTKFYGARPGGFTQEKDGRWRPYGMTGQIIEALGPIHSAAELAGVAYRAIKEMVPRVDALQDWLRQLALLCAKHHKYLRWTTLLGLPVIIWYHAAETKRIPLYLRDGRRKQVTFAIGYKKKIWKEKAADAAAANYTHSADATHLQLVALACAKEGIGLVTVHDCFGCIAPHAGRLKEILPDQFIHLHCEYNNLLDGLLKTTREQLPPGTKMPPIPDMGDLDIEGVRKQFHAWK
jgi:hypothetical protein